MKNNGLFQIKFDDKTQFVGNLFQHEWGKISDTQKILEIIFTFGEKMVKMENFLEYNLTYETHTIIGKKAKIVNITLVGRKENSSILLIFNFKNGKLYKKEVEKYKEYGNLISNTWKKGIIGNTPKIYYEK